MASTEDQGLPLLLMVTQRQGGQAKLDCQADRLLAVRRSNSDGPYHALSNLTVSDTVRGANIQIWPRHASTAGTAVLSVPSMALRPLG